jgi:hypothetical protein
MQTAPATSQKTPKVAKDNLLSAVEALLAAKEVSGRGGSGATSENATRGAACQARPDAGQYLLIDENHSPERDHDWLRNVSRGL